MVKNQPANAADTGDVGSIPGTGRSPRERNGNPLQYSQLENPMDRGAWWAAVRRVTESDVTELACRVSLEGPTRNGEQSLTLGEVDLGPNAGQG